MTAPKKNKTKLQPPAHLQNFPIVGIGASAGGLDAFKRLLAAIPESSGMAYVLVQHIDPSRESLLPEILQRVTKIPVHEITEDIHLAPDHIYVIPSNKMLTSTDGVLKLTDREKKTLNLSIDVFFTSLADVHKEFAVGVVLSGTGNDGTLGLKAIKEHGGISIAQDSDSAAYNSMPQSAVNAGVVDFILAPEKIPTQLLQINSVYKKNHFYKNEEELPKDDENIFKQILLLLRERSGVDFTDYKQPTFHRRIARRIAIAKNKNLADYLSFLRTDKAEQDALFQDVLIPVTSFFRDPETFQTLTETVFPALLKKRKAHEPIRVWIAGCSTGEEAFSIAICLHEFLGENINSYWKQTKIQIFASDISEIAIKKARAAIYSKADVEKLSATQLNNYFEKNNDDYKVNKLIREMCIFATHNFLKDPPFAKMDLISCRNVLIYMDTFLQNKAFATFHYALKENGFLLLGKPETTGASSDLFTQISMHDKIYSRKSLPVRFAHVTLERNREALATPPPQKNGMGKDIIKHEIVYTDFRKSAEAVMILKSPASVVVNEAMDIVHIHGSINPFLEAPHGKPTHNLIKMAREGLAFQLRNAIHKATNKQASVIKENISVKIKNKQSLVNIEIIPLTDTVEPHYLIRFEKKVIEPTLSTKNRAGVRSKNNESQKINARLKKELAQTHKDMRSITEDMEAYNEELQSANEELQSGNEEAQSLNEELETSKEELQSTNEELIITNQELIDKQVQLNLSHFYSEAIVTTMREPLVVLDGALRVKTANASFYKKFNIEEKNIQGKLFYETQNHQFDDALLCTLLEKILPQKNSIEDFEINLRLPDKGERIILINARQIVNENKAEQLILLAMEDITDKVQSENKIKESEAKFRNLVLQAPLPICTIVGPSYIVETINKPALKIWEKSYEELIDKPLFEVLPELEYGLERILKNVYTTGESFISTEMPVLLNRTTESDIAYFNSIYQPMRDLNNKIYGIILIETEVTTGVNARKQIEANVRKQKKLATQLKLATDSAKVGIWSLDLASLKLEWSNIHKKLWGYDEHCEDLTYEDWHKLIVPEDKELAFQRLEEAKVNRSIYQVEYRITRANDWAVVWIKSTGHYQYDKFGVALMITGISIDITEQKSFTEELETKVKERTEELQNLNKELNQINKQLEQFAHVASHDLQEPLRKIITFSRRLQDIHEEDVNTEVRYYLEKIENASFRMSTLIHDLLNYSRLLQHEKLFVQTDLNEILKNVVDDFELFIYEKKAQIKFDKLPTIDAVPLQMNQLFYNLISNALKFSREEVPPVITITSRTLSAEEIQKYPAFNPQVSYVEITFKDNGIGFEQQYAKQIFTIFQRLHSKEAFTGTGIGLALVKKIVENHYGEVFTESQENKGAEFHVILPIKTISIK